MGTSGKAGIDLITEGITTSISSPPLLLLVAGIDLITEGITTFSPHKLVVGDGINRWN